MYGPQRISGFSIFFLPLALNQPKATCFFWLIEKYILPYHCLVSIQHRVVPKPSGSYCIHNFRNRPWCKDCRSPVDSLWQKEIPNKGIQIISGRISWAVFLFVCFFLLFCFANCLRWNPKCWLCSLFWVFLATGFRLKLPDCWSWFKL